MSPTGPADREPSLPDLVVAAVAADPARVVLRTAAADHAGGEVLALAGGIARAVGAGPPARPFGTAAPLAPGALLLLVADPLDALAGTLAGMATGRVVVHADPRLGPGALAEVAALAGAEVSVGSTDVRVDGLAHVDPRGTPAARFVPRAVEATALAVLGFTSGSTGRPRPIGRTHAELRERATAEPGLGDPGPGDRLGTLLGATASLASNLVRGVVAGVPVSVLDARTQDVAAIVATWAAHRVTHLRLVPTFLRRLAAGVPEGVALPELVSVSCSGEPVVWDDVAAVRARFNPRAALVNRYGMSEGSRVARGRVGPDEPLGTGPVPVGPIAAGRRVWIDAGDGLPAPAGVAGEVVLEGDLRRVGPTYEELPDGLRRLRTGDRGVLDGDGVLTHLGRIDRLVKLGGIRVELGAVEAVVRAVEGVVDVAVVDVVDGAAAETVLVAHVVAVPVADGGPTDAVLTDAAAVGVHRSAVPVAFVRHAGPLPTLATGKVDLARLRAAGVPAGADRRWPQLDDGRSPR